MVKISFESICNTLRSKQTQKVYFASNLESDSTLTAIVVQSGKALSTKVKTRKVRNKPFLIVYETKLSSKKQYGLLSTIYTFDLVQLCKICPNSATKCTYC
jgi:hypothetical protein